MIVECPTPQRNPTFDKLVALGCPLHVLYISENPKDPRGWGDLQPTHDHSFWDSFSIKKKVIFLGRLLLKCDFSSIVCFGYRGLPRVAALIASRVNGSEIKVRSDTSQLEVMRQSHMKRYLKRVYLHLLIPRKTVAWCIGTQNEIFWSREVGLSRLVRIPYEVPILPGGKKSSEIVQRYSNPDSLKFLFVGRLVPYKHVQDAINAFRRLSEDKHRQWTFTIVGDGPEQENLKSISQGDPRISFTGAIPYSELSSVFMSADVLVLTSDGEAWGLVVNEALGFGLYVIASDLVGCAVDLIDQETGRTYASTNVSQLEEAMSACTSHLARIPRGPRTDTPALMYKSLTS